VLAVANFAVLSTVAVPLIASGAAAIVYGLVLALFALRKEPGEVGERGQAFNLWTAIGFAALLSAILLASQAMNEWFGGRGLTVTAAVAGIARPRRLSTLERSTRKTPQSLFWWRCRQTRSPKLSCA
jgi:uncharacterized membrane protein (DUF4010 family)